MVAPRIRGRVRPRPPARIRRARTIMYVLISLIVIVEVVIAIAILLFRMSPSTFLPAIVAPVAVAAVSWVAIRGFRDRTLVSFGLAVLVALFLDAAGIGLYVLASGNTPGIEGNIAFVVAALGTILLLFGIPLTWNLFRDARWFTQRESRTPVATAETLEAETDTELVAATAVTAVGSDGTAEAGALAGTRPAAVEPLVSVRGLKKHFPIVGGLLRRQIGTVYAVDGVDFDIQPGEVFSLVGESGCGKTTLGRTLLQLTPPTAGKVIFDGYELTDVDPDDMRPLRRRMQIIFQDPFGSLNPRMPVSDIIGEGLLAQGVTDRKERDKKVEDSLEIVGLRRDYTRRYPHEFSGGQRQRIGVARALALGPDFIVCDEPVSALDVSIQSQVLNLLRDLRRDFNLTYLFISHNLSVIQYFSDRVAVMYLGRIVELGTVEQLYRDPRHPYTVALLSAIPLPDPRRRKRRLVLKGDVPSPAAPPAGCHFHTRCWLREQLGNPERCVTEDPALRPLSPGHSAACHFSEEINSQSVDQVTAQQSAVATAVADQA
jgi:oligopeptide/dipeptide ABC transporter ATP-binding protein